MGLLIAQTLSLMVCLTMVRKQINGFKATLIIYVCIKYYLIDHLFADLSGNSWTNNHDNQPLPTDTFNHINAVEEANASPYEVLSKSSYVGEQLYFDQTQIKAENHLESTGPQINTCMSISLWHYLACIILSIKDPLFI
jgi:hypothetical protein